MGRTKHFISAFGEHVIGEEVEYSLQIKIAAPTSVSLNSKFAISGFVNPGKAVLVALERFDGKWIQVATAVTDSNGAYSFTYTAGLGPFVNLRVSSGGSQSAAVTVVLR